MNTCHCKTTPGGTIIDPGAEKMIALRDYQPQAQQTSSPRLAERISHKRRDLANIAQCFRDQPFMLPLQCSETVQRLDSLRRATRYLCETLCNLDPETTQRLRPYGSIDKLTMLDYQLTEIILHVAMLAPICQAVSYERINLHLYIRSLFPRALVTFEDTISQLAALNTIERQTAQAWKEARA